MCIMCSGYPAEKRDLILHTRPPLRTLCTEGRESLSNQIKVFLFRYTLYTCGVFCIFQSKKRERTTCVLFVTPLPPPGGVNPLVRSWWTFTACDLFNLTLRPG